MGVGSPHPQVAAMIDGTSSDYWKLADTNAPVTYINHFIRGVPYGRDKVMGNLQAPKDWSEQIKIQTKGLPRVKEACALNVTFLLPPDKYPKDFPYGSDLDNLLKRLLDGLNETIFADAQGHDSCVVILHVMKTKVASYEESGAHIEVLPVSVS